MKCSWNYGGNLFWIRLVPGKLPEVLGKAFGSSTVDRRIKITEENKAILLHIVDAKTSDSGYYYCMKFSNELAFSKEIHLNVEGK